MKKLLSLFVCAAALVLLDARLFGQEVIINGGFEDSTPGTADPPTQGDFAPGWVHTGDTNMLDEVSSDSLFAHTGDQFISFGSNPDFGELSQTFATIDGAFYTVSFYLAHDVFDTADNAFNVLWNGVLVPNSDILNLGTQDYTLFTFSGLVGGAGTSTLTFQARDSDDFFRLDDVSVVPEPSVTWLALSGLAVVGALQVRRFRRA
jgi:hypothetical protein